MPGQRLTRDPKNSMLGGVCAGFAKRYGFDATLVRIVLVLLTVVTGGIGVPVYIAAWIVMPVEDASVPVHAVSDAPASLGNDVREVSDRLVEAARVLAGKTREAAEEISEIARRAPASSNNAGNKNAASVSATIEQRGAEAESAPPATMEEDEDLANGRESDEGLPPVAPASSTSSPSSPSGLPRAMSDQSPNPPPPTPQAGAPWSTAPSTPPVPPPPPTPPTPPVPPAPPAP